MAEKKENDNGLKPEEKKEDAVYIATENCYFGGRYLARGDKVTLGAKPDHACLVPWDGKDSKAASGFYDPIAADIEKKRIQASLPGFVK